MTDLISLEHYSFIGAIISLGLCAVFLLAGSFMRQKTSDEKPAGIPYRLGYCGRVLQMLGLVLLTASIVTRGIITGHGPFSSMYEFCIAFAWGISLAGLFFWWRYKIQMVNAFSVAIATGLLIVAYMLPSRHEPLVPALQQSVLLTSHVAAAIVAYGSFTVGFISAVLYLWQRTHLSSRLPQPALLDEISYRTVLVGFPFLTLVIILGALWADVAWGRYWGWDPKETASLVTWLIFAVYLHARLLRGWRDTKAAILLIAGFGAVLFTFFGNYIFSGLHTYL
jgi:cytochrome c-type biogenesis protein CcsB